MKKKSERKRELPPENWPEFKIYFDEIIDLSQKIIFCHNKFIESKGNSKTQYSISKIKENLDKMLKFEQDLPVYEIKYGSNIGWRTFKNLMSGYLVQINKVLQSRYSYFYVHNRNSNYKAKAYLEESLYYLNEAIKYRDKHTKHFTKPFEKGLELDREELHTLLQRYQPIDNPNEIDALLVSARSDKDITSAYEKFEKARDLAANDSLKQFNIALEQAEFYFIKHDLLNVSYDKLSQAKIDDYDDCILKSTKPLIIAAILVNLNKVECNQQTKPYCHVICDKLYLTAKYLYDFSMHTKDLDRQITLLKHSNTNLIWGIKLANKINYEDKIISIPSAALQDDIATQLKSLELAKEEKIKELAEKTIKEAELEKCIADYDEKFTDLLKQYEIPKQILKKTTVVKAQDKQSKSTSSSSSEVEIEAPKTTFTFVDNFDLNYQLKLLEDANKGNNSVQQIHVSTDIGEHFQLKAKRSLKKKEYNNAIENLKLAIEYFTQAHQLLTSKSNTKPSQKELVLRNLLLETNMILTNTLKAYKEIQDRFEQSRLKAMEYIIDKYGPEAWFRSNETARPKSKNAKILEDATQKVALLERMQNRFQQNFQIKEPPQLAANLVKHSAIFQQAVLGENTKEAPVMRPVT